MSLKNKLNEEVWTKKEYYQIAKKGLDESSHEGMRILKDLATQVNTILDLGCGEGSRLNEFSDSSSLVGVDISQTAIEWAKKNYPKINFIKADLEKIPLKDSSFDLVYSAFVLEHLQDPVKVLKEAVRVLSKDGFLILIAPNYGAPNRCSPPYKGSRIRKTLTGFINDFLPFTNNINNWTKVDPITDQYFIDSDTTLEPYIRTLMTFLESQSLKIREFTSCWSEELSNAKFHQKVFRFLGEKGLYPFLMWGPHLVVVAQKVNHE